MVLLLILIFILIPAVLAVVNRTALIYFTLLIGMIPINLGNEGMTESLYGRMDVSATRLLGVWVAAFFIILGNFDRVSKYIYLYRFHFIFLLFCCLSLAWSPSLAYGTRMLAKLSAPLLFMLIIMAMITSLRHIQKMEQLILSGGVGALILAILNWIFHFDHSSTLTVPGTTSAYFSAYTVVLGALVLADFENQRTKKNIILLAFFIIATLAGFTRITIGAMFVSFSVILFMAEKGIYRFLLPLAGLAGLPALFLFSETFKKRMFYGENKINLEGVMNDPSIVMLHLNGSGRFSAWPQILNKFFKPNPIEGSGMGATQNFYYTHSIGLGAVHSEYVRLLADVGLVGLLLFVIAMLFYLARMIRTYYSNSSGVIGKKYALAAAGGIIAYLIFIATDNGFDYVTGFGFYVFGLIAMADKVRELEQVQTEILPKKTDELIRQKAFGPFSGTGEPTKPRRYPIIEGKRYKHVIS